LAVLPAHPGDIWLGGEPILSLNCSSFWWRRIHNVLKGIPDDRDGLFDTIQRSKNHYQKRAYQCIKCMVALFSNCSVAYKILQVNAPPHHRGSLLLMSRLLGYVSFAHLFAHLRLMCVHRATAT